MLAVVHVVKTQMGMGLEFVDMDPDSNATLLGWIENLRKSRRSYRQIREVSTAWPKRSVTERPNSIYPLFLPGSRPSTTKRMHSEELLSVGACKGAQRSRRSERFFLIRRCALHEE